MMVLGPAVITITAATTAVRALHSTQAMAVTRILGRMTRTASDHWRGAGQELQQLLPFPTARHPYSLPLLPLLLLAAQ
jgi:hypothetical protein